MAYADVYDLMDMTEELVSGLVKHIHGSYKTVYHTIKGEEININWEGPWRKIEMIPALEEAVGEKFPPADTLHTEEANQFFKRVLAKTGVECSPPLTNARMLDALVGEYLESQCVRISPTVDDDGVYLLARRTLTQILKDQSYLHHWPPQDDVTPC